MDRKYIAFGDSYDAGRKLPLEFCLLKLGKSSYTKNGKKGEFELSADDAKAIIEEFNGRAKDLVVDYDHSTLRESDASKGDAPAAGWAQLVLANDGIFAKMKSWTDKAKGMLEKGEYRYFSPVVQFNKDNQRPMSIHSIGLTNHPAIHGTMPLVAANDLFADNEPNAAPSTLAIVEQHQSLIKELKDALDENKNMLKENIDALVGFADKNPSIRDGIQKFIDDTFAVDVKALTDAAGEDAPKEPEKVETVALADVDVEANLLDQLNKLNKQVQALKDEAKTATPARIQELDKLISAANVQIVDLQRLLDEHRKGKETQVAAVAISPATVSLTDLLKTRKESKLAMTDFDPEGDVVAQAEAEIKALSDYRASMEADLAAAKAKSVKELAKMLADAGSELQQSKAARRVEKLMAEKDCRITEAMHDWAIQFLVKDPEAFDKWYAGAPVAFSSNLPKAKPAPSPQQTKFNKDQADVAAQFGRTPDEVYGS